MKTGRKTFLDNVLADEIAKIVSRGTPPYPAAISLGITKDNLAMWLRKGRDDVANNRESEYSYLVNVLEQAMTTFEQIQVEYVSQHEDWRARSWMLERHPATRERWAEAGVTSDDGVLAGLLARLAGVRKPEELAQEREDASVPEVREQEREENENASSTPDIP